MKTKQLLILGGVFVVLALVVLLFENPFGQSEYEKKVQTAMPLFPNFDKAQVAGVEIIAAGESTTLAKQDGKWVVTSLDSYPADAKGVEKLLTKVSEFKNTHHVSSNSDKQMEFEVESTTGVEVKLMDANDTLLAHLFVGKTTPGFLSSYVRVADTNDVYVAQGYLKSVFDKGERTWKDRTIFDFDEDIVTQVNITSPEETVELRLDAEGTWQMLQPEASAVKQAEVDSLLATFSQLDTDDFAEPKELTEYELASPHSSISATLNDGTTATLLIGKEEEDKLYVKRADGGTVFRLFKSNVDRLIKKAETLKEEAAPPTEAEAEVTPTE